jgi:hypothetical protein
VSSNNPLSGFRLKAQKYGISIIRIFARHSNQLIHLSTMKNPMLKTAVFLQLISLLFAAPGCSEQNNKLTEDRYHWPSDPEVSAKLEAWSTNTLRPSANG